MSYETKGESEEGVKFNAEVMAQMESQQQNPPRSTKTLDQTEQRTKVEQFLRRQSENVVAQEAKVVDNDEKSTETVTMSHQSLPFFDDLRPEDRVECSALSSATNQTLLGKFLLCQTISISTEDVAPFVVTVTDPKGARAMRLALHNYSAIDKPTYKMDFNEILPPGNFLVLKNPSFKSIDGGPFMLHCDNPAEVELISRKRVETKFPDLEWTGAIAKIKFHLPKRRNFWGDFENDEAAFTKLKEFGNKAFENKRFSDAIRFYDMAFDYCTENKEHETIIHSNKSAALLALGCFNAAEKCADLALKLDPENPKCNRRKTKALIGLGRYKEALEFLEEKFDQFSSLRKREVLNTFLDSVKLLTERKNLGPTESQLVLLRMGTLKDDDNFPEFIGLLATVSQVEDKGRGQVATEDISLGQLLICTKAFCYAETSAPAPSSSTPIFKTFNHRNNPILDKPSQDVVRIIANKLHLDPELAPAFYNLSAGDDLGHLEPGDKRIRHVDIDRIKNIVKINAFDSGQAILNDKADYLGLWLLPSFFNHSCSEHNCVWIVCGEWLTLTSIADIKKGEELTLPYIRPICNYETRQGRCQYLGFSCNCKLCKLEASEPIFIRNERQKILNNLGKVNPKCIQEEIQKALEEVEKLVSLRKDNMALNFPLLFSEVVRLWEILFLNERFGECSSVLYRMFEVADASVCWAAEGTSLAIRLMFCHAFTMEKELLKKVIATIKRLMLKFYGNLEPMRLEEPEAVVKLKKIYDIDFFQDD